MMNEYSKIVYERVIHIFVLFLISTQHKIRPQVLPFQLPRLQLVFQLLLLQPRLYKPFLSRTRRHLPPAVPAFSASASDSVPAFPPVSGASVRVPLPALWIPLPGNRVIAVPSCVSYCQLVCSHVSVTFEICLESHLFWNIFERFMANCNVYFLFSFGKCPFLFIVVYMS